MVLVTFKFQGIFCNKISTDDEKVKLYTKKGYHLSRHKNKFKKEYDITVIDKLDFSLDCIKKN